MNSLSLRPVLGLLLASLGALAADPNEQVLFNGRDLEGWDGNRSIWSVRDGAITGTTTEDTKLKHNTFLVWKGGTVGDFELRLKYRIVNGNSGIQYRSKVAEQGPQGPIVGGYQADFEAGKTYSGILYEERGRGILAQRGQLTRVAPTPDGKHSVEVLGSVGKSEDIQSVIRSEDWNDYLIIARGNRLTHIINGRVTADVIDDDSAHAASSGVLALQVHVGPPMTVQAKDIRLKTLASAGPGSTTAASPEASLARMLGEWVAVSAVRDGEPVPQEFTDSLRLKILAGGKYQIRWEGGDDAGAFQLRADGRGMDIQPDASGSVEGIYRFEGDNLRIATGMDGAGRPRNFESQPGSSSLSVLYRRK